MQSIYPACFFEEENAYSVVFPDLDHLSTCGDSLEDAMKAAVDCLAGYLYSSKKEGIRIPKASPMIDIQLDALCVELKIPQQCAFINMVAVDVNAYAKTHFEKSVKKTLTIPMWLNQAALEQNINFSQVLQEALIEKLKQNL